MKRRLPEHSSMYLSVTGSSVFVSSVWQTFGSDQTNIWAKKKKKKEEEKRRILPKPQKNIIKANRSIMQIEARTQKQQELPTATAEPVLPPSTIPTVLWCHFMSVIFLVASGFDFIDLVSSKLLCN